MTTTETTSFSDQVNEFAKQAANFPCPGDIQPAVVHSFPKSGQPYVDVIFVKKYQHKTGQNVNSNGKSHRILKLI